MTLPYLVAARQLAAAARATLPEQILAASGRVLYSPASTLSGKSPIYFLGLNPGEDEAGAEQHNRTTVEEDLERLATDKIAQHAYLDEKWKNASAGMAPIQMRGKQVFSIIAGEDQAEGLTLLRNTPVSNFIFRRSPSEAALKQHTGLKPLDLANLCWPLHDAVIRHAGIKIVLTHAVGIAREFANSRGLGLGHQRPSGWGGTLNTLYAWDMAGGVRMLAIPNLSRYSPGGQRTEALAAFFKEFAPASSTLH